MNNDQLNQLCAAVGTRLQSNNATITVAESCTGGWISKVMTDISGSSKWFEMGFITYSDKAKQQLIGVNRASLKQWGAVSEQVVREMALGALHIADADFAISVSGIAGPDGGSAEKPTGTIWFAFASAQGELMARLQMFSGDREAVRYQAVGFALQTLYDDFLQKLT